MNPIDIIGIGMGPSDLTMFHMELIQNCDILVGGARQLSMFPEYNGKTLTIDRNIDGLIKQLRELHPCYRIVVLASGDPMFYGIGTTLSDRLPKNILRIHPNVSSVAAAFSKIGISWQDAEIISLHSSVSGGMDSTVFENDKIIFLTAPNRGPAEIAFHLHLNKISFFHICVLENLGNPDRETIRWFYQPEHLLDVEFSNPNVVILVKPNNQGIDKAASPNVSHETHLGLPDSFFVHSQGLITKSEIRVLSLAKLQFTRKDHLLWDIGSGSGSVGLEAALILTNGQIFAIEKNKERIGHISENCEKLGLSNFHIKLLNFPDGAESLPKPDRIFIGGGGRNIDTIVGQACNYLSPGGILVVNTVIIENMIEAMKTLSDKEMNPSMIQAQISRSAGIADGHRLSPLNPVWVISGRKPN